MEKENKVFIGGAAAVLIATFVYIGYSNIGNSGDDTPSDMAFSGSPNTEDSRSLEQEQARSNVETASTQETTPTTQQNQASQGAGAPQAASSSSYDGDNTGSGIIQDPAPVPPAEREGGEMAKALRNLRIQTEGIQQRMIAQGQALRSLQQQVNGLTQKRREHQESLNEAQQTNEALRSQLSGKGLYAQPNSEQQLESSTERTGERNKYQLTKLLEDQAWIHTPQGRTYIVEEGDWFGDEYVISINSVDNAIITTAGELAL